MSHNAPPAGRRTELVEQLAGDHQAIALATLRQRLEPLMASTLSIQQLKVLVLAQVDGPVSAHALATRLGVSAATMSGIVERLVDAELLERHQDDRDRRVWLLTPTATGAQVVEDVVASGEWSLSAVLARLELTDLEALGQGLAAVRRVVEQLAAEDELASPDGAATGSS